MVHMRLHYFYIEFRFHRYPKKYLKDLIRKVSSGFRGRLPPHVTLYGPFETRECRGVFSRIEKVAKKYTLVPFSIHGFEPHEGKKGKVIAAHIIAPPELKSLRRELAEELNKIVKIDDRRPWDNEGSYWFHSTIAQKITDQRKFEQIWHDVNKNKKPHINQHLVRITVLNRRERIELEYDLMFKRWLTRREALSRHLWRKTINRLRELQGLPPEREPSRMHWLRRIFRWLS
ncbi:MAG TPA: 2'-5' RNA ligase family protein [Dehalococcoidales bacterium]|nr:2'-5' RNA ligase family protein [Dehalococcoidales bacterium]